MEREGHIGAHSFRLELPDTLVFCAVGDLHGPDIDAFYDELWRFAEGKQHVFILVDVTRMGSISPEARKRGMRLLPDQVRGLVIFGASFGQRVIMTLLQKAFTLLFPVELKPSVFLETERQARAWIQERRAALTTAAASAGSTP